MVLDDTRPELVRFEDCAAVVLHDRHPAVPLFAHGTLLMILQGLACWLTDRRIALIGADLAQPEPIHGEEYRVLFGRETRFGRGRTVLRFDATALALAVVRRPADLRDFLQAAPANFLVRYRNPDSLAARIRHSLRRREPADWPDFDTLAKQFNASASTLRRRLDEEGQSYQGIKDAAARHGDRAAGAGRCVRARGRAAHRFCRGERVSSRISKMDRGESGELPGAGRGGRSIDDRRNLRLNIRQHMVPQRFSRVPLSCSPVQSWSRSMPFALRQIVSAALLCIVCTALIAAEHFHYGRFGTVAIYRPGDGDVRSVALLLSGDGGRDAGTVALASGWPA